MEAGLVRRGKRQWSVRGADDALNTMLVRGVVARGAERT